MVERDFGIRNSNYTIDQMEFNAQGMHLVVNVAVGKKVVPVTLDLDNNFRHRKHDIDVSNLGTLEKIVLNTQQGKIDNALQRFGLSLAGALLEEVKGNGGRVRDVEKFSIEPVKALNDQFLPVVKFELKKTG
jgi:hypothetical protein